MAKIYNSDCTKGLAQNAGIQQSVEKVPNELAEKIVPTFETNPQLLKKDVSLTNDKLTTGTLFVTPTTTRQFYLTGFVASYVKDAVCDSATGLYQISYTSETGATAYLMNFPIITLTAQQESVSHTFKNPIKLGLTSAVGFSGTFTVGVLSRSLTIYGYYEDTYNA